jgi:hypothetical protein
MHAFMAAVLLRVTGLDSLDLDTEPEPPDRELGEIESIRTGEGDAVIGSDGGWLATLGKQLLEGGKCEVFDGSGRYGALYGERKTQNERGGTALLGA